MTVYHIEMKKDGNTFQFVSKDIGEKAMFRWVYSTMDHNLRASLIIYQPTQLAGSNFKIYNEIGRVRHNNGIKFYMGNGRSLFITPKGTLTDVDPNAGRL